MYCGKCGAEIGDDTERCNQCGEPANAAQDATDQPAAESVRPQQQPIAYAGFWLRFVAFVLDLLIVGLATGPVTFKPLLSNVGAQASMRDIFAFYMSGSTQATAITLLMQLIYWLYYAAFESSKWQATLGKKFIGIYVTDMNGTRISFARASGRHFGKLLSQFILFFGYVMAGFTEKKQALHDMLAGCLVMKKTS